MTQSLFDPNKQTEESIDPTKDYFAELVGENAKFKTPQDLARSKLESDLHIRTVEKENADLRNELTARLTLEQQIDKIAEKFKEKPPAEDGLGGEEKHQSTTPTKAEIEKLVKDNFTLLQQARAREKNIEYVEGELKKTFGDDYSTKVRSAAKQLGLAQETMEHLAAEQPKAFLKLFTPSKVEEEFTTPPKTSVNFTPSVGKEKTYSFYKEERKKFKDDPRMLRKLDQLEWQDAVRLGEAFYQ